AGRRPTAQRTAWCSRSLQTRSAQTGTSCGKTTKTPKGLSPARRSPATRTWTRSWWRSTRSRRRPTRTRTPPGASGARDCAAASSTSLRASRRACAPASPSARLPRRPDSSRACSTRSSRPTSSTACSAAAAYSSCSAGRTRSRRRGPGLRGTTGYPSTSAGTAASPSGAAAAWFHRWPATCSPGTAHTTVGARGGWSAARGRRAIGNRCRAESPIATSGVTRRAPANSPSSGRTLLPRSGLPPTSSSSSSRTVPPRLFHPRTTRW
ncbi:unnamed protein product, partial [Ectocarpus sp. 13 AM-2016]